MKKVLLLSVFVTLGYLLNAQTLEIIGNGNLRAGPSTTNEIIGKVSIGTKVTQIDFSNDWYKIELPNKSSGWIYKSLVKAEKQSNSYSSQKPDTIQLTANAIANTIREALINSYKRQSYGTGGLLITQEYQLFINLSHDLNGSDELTGIFDSITIIGKINLVNKGEMRMIYNNLDQQSSGTSGTYTMVDPSSTFLSIDSGEYNCGGHFRRNDTPIYFENGKITFTDNVKPCSFSEGSTFFYDTIGYKYTNLKWVKMN
jgi:uncharacterized protein YraI